MATLALVAAGVSTGAAQKCPVSVFVRKSTFLRMGMGETVPRSGRLTQLAQDAYDPDLSIHELREP